MKNTNEATGHKRDDQGHITTLFFPKGFKARIHWEGTDWREDSVVNVPAFALVEFSDGSQLVEPLHNWNTSLSRYDAFPEYGAPRLEELYPPDDQDDEHFQGLLEKIGKEMEKTVH